MTPMYRYMDPYPQQRNQTFSSQHYHYPFEPNAPMAFVPWPSSHGYPNPMFCYPCCNHGNAPGYNGFRPFFPCNSMPSPMPFGGGYPAPYHEANPVHYVPPPHYSMELPKYDYDKEMPRSHHWCGCPNSHCHQKSVKIEEQGSPDVVEKKVNDSSVPEQMKNYPFPVVWIPPEYMNSGEQKKTPSDVKPPESLKPQKGDPRHGLFPFDLNNIGSLMQSGSGNRKHVQDQCREDGKSELPFQIFRMPSYDNKPEGVGKKYEDMDASQDQQIQELKKQFPFPFFWLPYEFNQKAKEEENKETMKVNADPTSVPMKLVDTCGNENRVNEETGDKYANHGVQEGKAKDAIPKLVQVKQLDVPKNENSSEDGKRRGREVQVKNLDDNSPNKLSDGNVRSQSLSPKKSSKLPPVCLRVDPLPSKKNGSRRSRSSSPPGLKQVQQETPTDTTTKSASCGLQEKPHPTLKPLSCVSSNGNEVRSSKEENMSHNVDTSKVVIRKPTDGEDETKETSGRAPSIADGIKCERKRLLDIEAAVLIQSAYRGFDVRRWEPLKKLKQIAEIREQVADVQNSITSLENSEIKKDDKQRIVIGETIMRLLLKLDTIQGLLPGLRDLRRSLARELVCLQEKLDDLMLKKSQDTAQEVSTVKSQKSQDSMQHMPTVKSQEELGTNANNDISILDELEQEEAARCGEELPADVSESSNVATESCQEHVFHPVDSLPGVQLELPKPSEYEEMHIESENGEVPPVDLDTEDVVDGQAVVVDTEPTNGDTQLEQGGRAQFPVEEMPDPSVVLTCSEVLPIAPESLDELPQVGGHDYPSTTEPVKDESLEMSKDEVELTISPDIISPVPIENGTEKEAELPLSLTEEDGTAGSELKNNGKVQIVQENDIPEFGEEESQVAGVQRQQNGTIDKMVKEEHQNEDEILGDSVLDPEMEHHHQSKASEDDLLPVVGQTFETLALNVPVDVRTLDAVHGNQPSDDDSRFTASADAERPNENEATVQECRDGAEIAKENVLLATSETIPASPPIAAEPSPLGVSVVAEEGTMKLVEENEKLREMMEKLLVTGKDQLQVIYDLTGRVKDLEKKLAKKKKLKTRRSRAAKSGSFSSKPINKPLKEEKDADVAM